MAAPHYRFTAYDMDSCLEMARVLHGNGGVLSPDQLAHQLGYKSANNGAFNTRLANARLFGLVEGSSELRSSTRAIQILFPDFPQAAKAARVEAFEAVPLYAAVLNAYHGLPLPDEKGLKNALATRWGVNADKVPTVYLRLIECAEQAGLFELAGGRTKLLRPIISDPTSAGPTSEQVPVVDPAGATPSVTLPGGVAANALIQAALAELPPQGDVTEDQLRQWLAFFESALRVTYRLPNVSGLK